MKIYKLRHKPTGLFFTPSKGSGNLSRTGKAYTSPPSLKWVECIRVKMYAHRKSAAQKLIMDFFGLEYKFGMIDTYLDTPESHWEIIEM